MTEIRYIGIYHAQIAVHPANNYEPKYFSHIQRLDLGTAIEFQLTDNVVAFELLPAAAENLHCVGLRELLSVWTEPTWQMVAKGVQLIDWVTRYRFCSQCGGALVKHPDEVALHCVVCRYVQYPRINPCVMVLVRRGTQTLLVRSARHARGHYSLIAGFIDAGETAEQAAIREVAEEVGLSVGNLRYLFSQSWPFPHSLMLGFVADYVSGDLQFTDQEVIEARWCEYSDIENLTLPSVGTMSLRLIELWRAGLVT